MKSRNRSAFSLLEIIAAVIILAVVATATVSTVAPMRAKSDTKLNDATIADLNGMAQSYYLERGTWPRAGNNGIADLAVRGYIDYKGDPANYNNLRAKYVWDSTTLKFKLK